MAEMHRIDATMSPHKADSELSLLNAGAADGPVAVSEGMFGLLSRALAFSKLSGGAFDITFASAGHLYDYRAGVAPDAAALADALPLIDWRHVLLDPAARSVRFARQGVRIDLGGFAKGHAVDNAIAILRRLGIANAMVAAGGDSHVMGSRGDRPWTVAIRDPRREGAVVAVLPLEDVSISTSGDYERFFERDGVRCHHLLDPRTGRSPERRAQRDHHRRRRPDHRSLLQDGLRAGRRTRIALRRGPRGRRRGDRGCAGRTALLRRPAGLKRTKKNYKERDPS